jgi:hypothetical protein
MNAAACSILLRVHFEAGGAAGALRGLSRRQRRLLEVDIPAPAVDLVAWGHLSQP